MNQSIAEEALLPYLLPTREIERDHPLIRRTAEELTAGCSGEREKAVRIFYFVRDAIHYNMYPVCRAPGCFRC